MSTNMFGVPVEGFAQKSKEAATEGIVLLKNEGGMLPLTQEDKISVFGRPQIEYYRSGTGSGGAVNVEYATNILDGFENSNLNIDETLVEKYKNWLKDHPFDNGGGGWACEPWFQKDMPIDEAFAKEQAAKTNKALYIIGRTAGEDKDNAIWQGSYILTDEEKENLTLNHWKDVYKEDVDIWANWAFPLFSSCFCVVLSKNILHKRLNGEKKQQQMIRIMYEELSEYINTNDVKLETMIMDENDFKVLAKNEIMLRAFSEYVRQALETIHKIKMPITLKEIDAMMPKKKQNFYLKYSKIQFLRRNEEALGSNINGITL